MTVVTSQPSTTPFELRNATLTLIALVLRTSELPQLSAALEERFGSTPALFEREPVVIDLSELATSDADIDFAGLLALLRDRSMVPVGVEGGNERQMAAALEQGLGEASTVSTARASAGAKGSSRSAQRAPAAAAAASTLADAIDDGASAPAAAGRAGAANPERAKAGAASNSSGASASSAPSAASAAPPASRPAAAAPEAPSRSAAGAVPTLVLDRPLRSGQQVYARGGDLVVMAAVNFGAEVIADGHIHVYAPLRGRAIAGARGNAAARIFSTCMEPQLVSIAGVYRTAENSLPDDVLGKPAQVRLEGDTLFIEALAP